MTREQIAEDLLTIVLTLGNELPPPPARDHMPTDVRLAEWSYVKGLASFAIMQLRDQLLETDRRWLSDLTRQSGPSRRADDRDAISQTVVDPRRGGRR